MALLHTLDVPGPQGARGKSRPINRYRSFFWPAIGLGWLGMTLTALLGLPGSSVAQSSLPTQFGEIIYQENPQLRDQIYIVAQSHRSAVNSRIGAAASVKVQAEIYRIGEWLILNRAVGVLLPEGYFSRATGAPARGDAQPLGAAAFAAPLDDRTLSARLADSSRFVNADMLLHANCAVQLQQIEDRDLYFAVSGLLRELRSLPPNEPQALDTLSRLNYQQLVRSARILHNIPAVMATAAGPGREDHKNAILTVGLAHVNEIMMFLKEGRTTIAPLPGQAEEYAGYSQDLGTLKKNYGISIILPRSLAENRELLQLAKLL